MIYLSAEVISGLGEDTFWTWFKREFPGSRFGVVEALGQHDIVLRYSTLGPWGNPTVALLWELHPEMKRVYGSHEWDNILERIYECARRSMFRVVASEYMIPFYRAFGPVDVLPIGINTDLFKPMRDKKQLREKWKIPQGKRVGFWSGTLHPMKGFDLLKQVRDTYWIVVWKEQELVAFDKDSATTFVHVNQSDLAELMNCADFFACTGTLTPFFMVEWEAMACDLPFVRYGPKREFEPSPYPREDVLARHWDRNSAKLLWADYLASKGVQW